MKKQPDLEFFQSFDAFWWSTLPEIKESANFICRNIPAGILSPYKLKRLKNTLKVILTNLHVVHKHDLKKYIAISMEKTAMKNVPRVIKTFS